MGTMTVRFPNDKHQRLKALAKAKGISLNKLMDELATVALATHDAEVHFKAMARKGDPQRGLALLEKLDQAFVETQNP